MAADCVRRQIVNCFSSREKQHRDTCPAVGIQALISRWPWQWFIIHRKQSFHLWVISDCLRLFSQIDQISHMPGTENVLLISQTGLCSAACSSTHIFVLHHQGFPPLGILDMLTCHMTFPCILSFSRSPFSPVNIKSLIPAAKAKQSFLKSRRPRRNIISNDPFASIHVSPFKVTQICFLGLWVCTLSLKMMHQIAPKRWDVFRKHGNKKCLAQTAKVTLQLYGMSFKRCAARWFTKTRINTQSESRMVSEMRETWGFSCSNFNYPIGGGGEETKAEVGEKKRGSGGRGGAAEMREKLYQSDHSSVLLQSPDKAGTAGGETMCIKTSWRSMASFCRLWKRQKRRSARDKKEKKPI